MMDKEIKEILIWTFLGLMIIIVSLAMSKVVVSVESKQYVEEMTQEEGNEEFESLSEESGFVPTKTPTQTQEVTVHIKGDVSTGANYDITNESEKVDYSTAIIVVAAIIMIPVFIIIMTLLFLKHKREEREHTERILQTDLRTFKEQELDELKQKYD